MIAKLVLEENALTVSALVCLARELFDYHFAVRVRRFLARYPPELRVGDEYFWGGYKKAPQQQPFDATNDTHVQFVQITTLLFSRIFSLRADEAFDAQYVKKVLAERYSEPGKLYWHLVISTCPLTYP